MVKRIIRDDILYIERVVGCNHNGEAIIAKVSYSKTGQTIYFNNKTLKKSKGPVTRGNYIDIESKEEYWVSGVKQRGSNRHWAANGYNKVIVQKDAKEAFLSTVKGMLPMNYLLM